MRWRAMVERAAGLPEVKEWRIHIGAHKTASTHIQHVLGDLRPQLLAEGLDVLVPHQGLREAKLASLASRRRRNSFPFLARASEFTDLVTPLRRGGDRVLVSEEGLLGWTQDAIGGRFYSGLDYMLAVLGRLSRTARVSIFLAIRAQEAFLPSLYAENLRHGPPPPGGFESVRAWMHQSPPRWSRLVEDIRRRVPRADLVVWRQEDFRLHEAEILARLVGHPVPVPQAAPDTGYTRSGSAQAIALAERLDPDLRGAARMEAVSALYADPAHEGPAFRPFDAEETAQLKRLYAADLEAIDRLAPGALLRFGSTERHVQSTMGSLA